MPNHEDPGSFWVTSSPHPLSASHAQIAHVGSAIVRLTKEVKTMQFNIPAYRKQRLLLDLLVPFEPFKMQYYLTDGLQRSSEA